MNMDMDMYMYMDMGERCGDGESVGLYVDRKKDPGSAALSNELLSLGYLLREESDVVLCMVSAG